MLAGLVSTCLAGVSANAGAVPDSESPSSSRFSDQPAPLLLKGFPKRPPPLIEWGDRFLGSGNLQRGFNLPTGANWTPNFWVFGDYRTAIQTFEPGDNTRITEWANRLDLYGNLQLSGTERILSGWRPLDNKRSKYSGYRFEPTDSRDWVNGLNLVPQTLFFEGEIGQIFPVLTRDGKYNLDYGFSIGRQPLLLQDGLLVNDDRVDLFSLTANALHFPGVPVARISGIFAWDEIERAHNQRDRDAFLIGLDAAMDLDLLGSTVEATALYVTSGDDGEGFYSGIGAIQRFGKFNTSFRVANSVALEGNNDRVASGTLLFAEASFDPRGTADLVYFNAFCAIDKFSSAARGPSAGGPLGRVGILNASVDMGNYGAPLNNYAENAVGANLGYQKYFGAIPRTQLVLEIGGRMPTKSPTTLQDQPAAGVAARFQKAFGQRVIYIMDAFTVLRDNQEPALGSHRQVSYGGRMEILVRF
jgi:hypothetical protein